jgi:hypothetical protein
MEETAPSRHRHNGLIKGVAVVAVLVIVVIATCLVILYLSSSGCGYGCGLAGPDVTINFTELGSGSMFSNVPVAWGLAKPFSCTACETVNLSGSVSSGLPTGCLGLWIASRSGDPVSTPWVSILWNSSGTAPLAGFSNGTWRPAWGSTLSATPNNNLHLMLISTSAITDLGYTLKSYGAGGCEVSGSISL